MKLLKLILILFCPALLAGQNVVPNYSFEDTTSVRLGPLYAPSFWKSVGLEGWNYLTPYNSPDFSDFSAPNNYVGFQQARTGNSYILLMIYDLFYQTRSARREYIQVKLNRSLAFDSTYCMRMYMSLADSFHFASKGQLGVYFSNNGFTVNHNQNIPYTPQLIVSPNNYVNDKVNWMEFNMEYKATGGERYMTIGNFNDTTAIDTEFVAGGGNQYWQIASYYYIDDIWLSHCDSLPDTTIGVLEHEIRNRVEIYPNPSSGLVQLTSKQAITQIEVYDLHGRRLRFIQQPAKQIELPENAGVYFLRIRLESGEVISRKVVRN